MMKDNMFKGNPKAGYRRPNYSVPKRPNIFLDTKTARFKIVSIGKEEITRPSTVVIYKEEQSITPIQAVVQDSMIVSSANKKVVMPSRVKNDNSLNRPPVKEIKPAIQIKTFEPIINFDVIDKKSTKKTKKLKQTKSVKRVKPFVFVKKIAFSVILVFTIVVTGYLSYSTWQINNHVKETLSETKTKTETKTLALSPPIDNMIKSDSDEALAEQDDYVVGSSGRVLGYSVKSDYPRAIYINKIGLAGKILPMGQNSDGSLQAPVDDKDAGWYEKSQKPGEPGAMLVVGHASETGTNLGLFGNVINLIVGDIITIERGDGAMFNYKIIKTEIVPLEKVDMSKTLVPYDGYEQSLNLISCTGKWYPDGSTLDHRLIVYSVLVN